MKKVLFVINTLGCAGAEKAMLELMKKFPKEAYDVSLYVLLGQGEMIHQIPEYVTVLNQSYCDASVLSKEGKKELHKRVLKRLFHNGSVFKNMPYLMSNLCSMLSKKTIHADKLLWKVMSDSADVLDGHYDLAIAFLEGGSTYFVRDHVQADRKITFLHVDYTYAGYTRELDQDCYLDFEHIFTVSDEVKESFLKVYPECKEKTATFHNLIDQEGIRKKAKLAGGFCDTYTGKRILTVGRLTPQKAYPIAIEAMKLLKDKNLDVKWYVLGEGELRGRLQKQIDALGLTEDFILLGAVENPYPYYAQCDLYVHATRFEGKSIAIQEAQTLGCAVLVSDCNGNREQVDDGTDGMLCQLDAEDISQKIAWMLTHEEICRQYGKLAAERVMSEQQDIFSLLGL